MPTDLGIEDRCHRLFLTLQYHPDTYHTSSLSLALGTPDRPAVWMRNPG